MAHVGDKSPRVRAGIAPPTVMATMGGSTVGDDWAKSTS
jgi:hypothetical protein